jgi:hypothetical protein
VLAHKGHGFIDDSVHFNGFGLTALVLQPWPKGFNSGLAQYFSSAIGYRTGTFTLSRNSRRQKLRLL